MNDWFSRDFCRSCLSTDFALEDLGDSQQRLKSLYPSLMEPDSNCPLPNKICSECASMAERAYQFQQMVIQSDTKIRELVTIKCEPSFVQFVEVKSETPTPTETVLESPKSFQCPDCLREFPRKLELRLHTSKPCKFDGEKRDLSGLEETSEGGDKRWKCRTCGRTFGKKFHCERHLLTHQPRELQTQDPRIVPVEVNGTTKLQCTICQKYLIGKRKNDWRRHLGTHESKNRVRFVCSVCQKGFYLKSDLKKHAIFHTDQRNFTCHLCGKSFFIRSSLNSHMLIHNEVRAHACLYCPMRFPIRSLLCQHLRSHLGSKNFECALCSKKFGLKSSLKKHMNIHTGNFRYSCEVCGKAFNCKANMQKHQRIHTGERPFGCSICNKRFSNSGDREKHLRVHLGPLMYACGISGCEEKFRTKGEQRRHSLIHGPDPNATVAS